MTKRGRWAAVLAALVAICLTAATAEARIFSEWKTHSPAGESARDPQIAVDSQGRATIVWVADAPGQDFGGTIKAIRLDHDRDPGPVQTLSDPGTLTGNPSLAIDSEDRVTVVWRTLASEGSDDAVAQALRLEADGIAGEIMTLSEPGALVVGPHVAVDSDDRATVIWSRRASTEFEVESVRIDSSGDVDEVLSLSGSGMSAFSRGVAIDSEDRATVVWTRLVETFPPFDTVELEAVRLNADRTIGPTRTLTGGPLQGDVEPRLGIDSEDGVTITWRHSGSWPDYCCGMIQAVRLGADGSPGSLQTLVTESGLGGWLAIASSGRATVLWQTRVPVPGGGGGLWRPGDLEWTQVTADGSTSEHLLDSRGVAGPPVVDSRDRIWMVGTQYGPNRLISTRLDPDRGVERIRPLMPRNDNVYYLEQAIDSQDRMTVAVSRVIGQELRLQTTRTGEVIPPGTRIVRGPRPGAVIQRARPTFRVKGTPASWIDHFECSLDGRRYRRCGATHQFKFALSPGRHVFRVRAVDDEGDRDPTPAVRRFRVSRAAFKACLRRARRVHARALRRASRLRGAERRAARKRAAKQRRRAADNCRIRFL